MDKNIDNLTGTESLDELEAMLEAIEREPDAELDDGTATEQTDVDPAPSAGEVAAGNEQANTEQGGEGATEPEKVILAKSGQHTIPYEVLEQSRNEVKVLREQLAASQQAQAERDKLQALMEKHGINPDVDPDDISQEELGLIAGVSRQVANRALQILEAEGLLRMQASALTPLDRKALSTYGD